MYDPKIEELISAALADGVLTEKEKQILFKKAQSEGIDLDEFEMVLDARLVELKKAEKEKAEKSAPKSNKYGDVRKCPVCGALVPALAGTCPECGYEFSGVDANLSSQKLAEMLLSAKSVNGKKEIIETFAIPNTKADLFEFLSALQPRIRDVKDPLSDSYFKKYQECVNKAKISFANDKYFLPYINSFEEEQKQIRKKRQRIILLYWIKDHIGGLIAVITVLLMVLGVWLIISIEQRETDRSIAQIEHSIMTGDSLAVINAVKESTDLGHPLELLTKLVETGNIDAAIYFYNNKTTHCPTYAMEWGDDAQFSQKACKLIYDALISSERMEDAWRFHQLESSDENYARNASSYFSYITDVVDYYCKNNDKNKARTFVKEHLSWFIKNVDNSKWREEYPDFESKKVNQRLMQQIKNY